MNIPFRLTVGKTWVAIRLGLAASGSRLAIAYQETQTLALYEIKDGRFRQVASLGDEPLPTGEFRSRSEPQQGVVRGAFCRHGPGLCGQCAYGCGRSGTGGGLGCGGRGVRLDRARVGGVSFRPEKPLGGRCRWEAKDDLCDRSGGRISTGSIRIGFSVAVEAGKRKPRAVNARGFRLPLRPKGVFPRPIEKAFGETSGLFPKCVRGCPARGQGKRAATNR